MTRQLHAAVPTSETPGADCKDVRDLYHPLNACGAQARFVAKPVSSPVPKSTRRLRRLSGIDETQATHKPLSRTVGSLYRSFDRIQCCLGIAGDLTFCDYVEELGFHGCRRVIVTDFHLG